MSKDEVMEDLHDVRTEDPAVERVIARVRAEYERAKTRPEIKKPMAYALYRIWREEDRNG